MADLYVQLKYGNPSVEQMELLEDKGVYDSLAGKAQWRSGRFPEADSIETLSELEQIREMMRKATTQEVDMSYAIDDNLAAWYCNQLGRNGKRYAVQIQRVINACSPTIAKVKYANQRPRPFQVALYLDFKLFPHETFSGHSPAWPSGHSCQARMITLCLTEMYPKLKERLIELENIVHNSRLVMGIHYPSDLQAGADLANQMFEEQSITQRLLQGLER